MPVKGSLLVRFVKNALDQCTYPQTLYWQSEEDKTFFLHCEHEKNKSCLLEQLKIFEDWDSAKPRQNRVASNSKRRQRLLQAFKKSTYFDIIEERSTKSKKLLKFTKDTALSTKSQDVLADLVSDLRNSSSSSGEPSHAQDNINFDDDMIWENISDTTMPLNDAAVNEAQNQGNCLNVQEYQANASSSSTPDVQVCGIQPVRLDGDKLEFVSDEEQNQDGSVKFMISLQIN